MTVAVFEVPRWAVGYGEDRFGLFADLEVKGVVQRMRWIPPGTYWQGSPESEAGRSRNEGPRRSVTFTKGFWLGETPVTQGFMDANGRQATSASRRSELPVLISGRKRAMRILAELTDVVREGSWRLPTEAEWEYACRAGTDTHTQYFNFFADRSEVIEMVDSSSWTNRNSGMGHVVSQYQSLDSVDDGVHAHNTYWCHPVKMKHANYWGLYDMLGNVWEICADMTDAYIAPYEPGHVVNPKPIVVGSYAIIRGGSGNSGPECTRPAARLTDRYSGSDALPVGIRLCSDH